MNGYRCMSQWIGQSVLQGNSPWAVRTGHELCETVDGYGIGLNLAFKSVAAYGVMIDNVMFIPRSIHTLLHNQHNLVEQEP